VSRVDFLTVDDVIAIHAMQVQRFGGAPGLRDTAALASAVAQASATFDGELLHRGVFEQAAAYLFHLVQNHAFVDGNKRVGLAAALVFLDLNGQPILRGTEELYQLTMAVARGEAGKGAVAEVLARLAGAP